MTPVSDPQTGSFTLQQLCKRLRLSYREARYVCERGWLPKGVDVDPGRGNHRRLTRHQAVWLGVVLKLKACGVRTSQAAEIAGFAEQVKGMSRNLNWDWKFSPFDGAFDTSHRWLLEVGEMKWMRFVTDANPSKRGLAATDWVTMGTRQVAKQAAPTIILQIDLSALARLLRDLVE